ncbi:MAG: hypothetical protein IT270_13830 [Saprospiraceae bacterium]|nr:hypothetical protein [Saprospiraceae bacterium]
MPYLRIHEETDAEVLSAIQSEFENLGLDFRLVKDLEPDLSVDDLPGSPLTYVEVSDLDVEEAFDVFYFFDIDMVNALSEEELALVFPPEKIFVWPTPEWLKPIDLGYRILLLIGLPVSFFFGYLFWRTNHVDINELIGHTWCVDAIVHHGNVIQSKTNEIPPLPGFEKLSGGCPEVLVFKTRGEVELPGIQTNLISGKWNKVSNKILEIKNVQEFEEIYEGTYQIKRSWTQEIELVSPGTTFVLHKKW